MPPNALIYRNINLGVTGQIVKATPGALCGYFIANLAAATRHIKLYNKATTPTSADTPAMTLSLDAYEKANVLSEQALDFPAGISARASTGLADNDTGAPAAGDVVVNFYYR